MSHCVNKHFQGICASQPIGCFCFLSLSIIPCRDGKYRKTVVLKGGIYTGYSTRKLKLNFLEQSWYRRVTTNCLFSSCTRQKHHLHCVSKNDTDVAHYNFDADQPILIIFGRDVAERVCYQMVICCPASSK